MCLTFKYEQPGKIGYIPRANIVFSRLFIIYYNVERNIKEVL